MRLVSCVAAMTFLFTDTTRAQELLTGHVIDDATGAPLEYVSIGTRASFSVSNADGSFAIPASDTMHFALIGYKKVDLPWAHWSGGARDVRMQAVARELDPVQVVASRVEERPLGVRTHHALFNYRLEGHSPEDILEVAQVVQLGSVPLRIKAVNVYISGAPTDSVLFRIGFRSFDGDRPKRSLVERSLIRRTSGATGWQRLDLSAERIALSGPVAVTLELLPQAGSTARWLELGIRLGGGERSYDRRTTFDDWNQPPHRYSINVSAMVPTDREKEEPDDPEPYLRSVDARMWSPAVQDSFSIAFGLPEEFDPKRAGGYPTVYLLDANYYFIDVLKALRKAARKGDVPPVILVGVGYRDFITMDSLRNRDYLFARSDKIPRNNSGERFLRFLCDQLVPYVDQHYRTDTTQRALAGHSFGGYFVLSALHEHAFYRSEHTFHAFIAASPDLAHGNGHLLKALVNGQQSSGSTTYRVFIGYGEEEGDADMQRYSSTIGLRLAPGSRVVDQLYRNADHMATALPSFIDGVQAIWGKEKR